MIRAIVLLLLAINLMSCAPDVHSLELDNLDLTDSSTVQHIRAGLNDVEKVAFAEFLVRHVALSSSYCGEPLVHRDGRPPATIGAAIELSIARSRAEKLHLARFAFTEPIDPAVAKRETLLRERDDLINGKMSMRAAGQDTPKDTSVMDEKIAAIEAQLLELES